MENEMELQKIYITPIIPGMKLTSLIAYFEAFGQIDAFSTNTHLHEMCVQYTNVDSAKSVMVNSIHCIDGNNMTVRWKPHIVDLNPFCLMELFEYVGIVDLCGLNETCAKFKEIAEKIFHLKFSNEVVLRTGDPHHLTYVKQFHNYLQASGMLKNFRHLIKSIRLEHNVSYEMHPAPMEHIVELIRDKFIDFSDLFCRKESWSSPEASSLKDCTFLKSGRNSEVRFRHDFEPEDLIKTVTEIHFFNVSDGTFIQKLHNNPNINAISICVNDNLPPDTIPQLCEHAPQIEYLALYQMGERNIDISGLKNLKRLKVLNLSLCNATAESLKSLVDLNVTIEGLLVRDAIIDESFVSYLTKFKQLQALVLIGDSFFDETRLAQTVGALPKLVTLVIDKKLSVDGLKKLVKGCTSLSAFEIHDLHDSPTKFEKLKKCFTTLSKLYLSSPNASKNIDKRNQSHIHPAQSMPVFNYMFENMITNVIRIG